MDLSKNAAGESGRGRGATRPRGMRGIQNRGRGRGRGGREKIGWSATREDESSNLREGSQNRGRGSGRGQIGQGETRGGESRYTRGGSQNRGRGSGRGQIGHREIREDEISNTRGGSQNKGRGRGRGQLGRGETRGGESGNTRGGSQNRGTGSGRGQIGRRETREDESSNTRGGSQNKGRGSGRGQISLGETRGDESGNTRGGIQNRGMGRGRGQTGHNAIRDGQTSIKRGRGRGETDFKTGGRGRGTRGQIGKDDNGDDQTSNSRRGVYSGGRGRGESGYKRGRGRGNAETSQQNPSGRDARRGIGYGVLKTWSENTDTEELLMQLCNKMESLEELMMGDKMREDWYSLLVQVINSAILCQHHTQELKRLLKTVCTTHFLTQMLSNYLDQKQMCGINWREAGEIANSIIKIIKQIVKHLPENAQNCRFALRIMQIMISDNEPVFANHDLEESITSLVSVITKVQNDRIERLKAAKSYLPCSDSETPPEDFRQLSVIPTVLDLSTDAKPFVRAIITKGAYRDQEDYLDILFRLMREDFVKPLRRGIQEYHEHIHVQKFRNSHIRLYHDVHFTGMAFVKGINHVVQFNVSKMKHVKWDQSKLLLNGNLICLSNDNFQSTLIFATVSLRDTSLLRKGKIGIVCHTGLDIALQSSSTVSFVMAESSAYYEAVHPILKGLQTIDSDLPMKEYIISCQRQLKPPTYLLKEVRKYDISCMMKTPRNTEVSVLNPLSWPSSESMCLNSCQREAAILALTKEISIIQGPPGTGKTYVGLKVMQVLLENQDRMLPNEISEHDPILVICYTNHALDQFLEGILEFCPDGIVRVGGNRSSTRLERFNLMNLKQRKEMSKSHKYSIYVLYTQLDHYCNKSKNVKTKLDSLNIDVLGEMELLIHIERKHYDSLKRGLNQANRKSKIHQWLNAPNKSLVQALSGMIKHHMTKLVMKCLQLLNTKAKPTLCFSVRQSIIERVILYGYWLHIYQCSLSGKMQQMKGSQDLLSLYRQSFQPSILVDSEICRVIPKNDFKKIEDFLNVASVLGQSYEKDHMIESWVLGVHNKCNKQLNDVEELNHFIKQFYCHEENDEDDFDDKEEVENELNKRQFFEDKESRKKHLSAALNATTTSMSLWNRAISLGISEIVDETQHQVMNDEAGFTTVTYRKPHTFSEMQRFLSDKKWPLISKEEEEAIDDVWSLGVQKRYALYKLWVSRYKEDLINEMDEIIKVYNGIKQKLTDTHMKQDIGVLRKAKVIGMTTTGAAKKRAWLEAVACRIIVVEEAAEVLEAHIVTALNKNCKHLILIGDHQQLRPSPTVYEHARHYGLNVSMFERLVNNGIPHVTLCEQHRMRESISVVMRHIYPNLQDHFSVKEYENIQGVSKNIFFIQHDRDETIVKDSLSKSNPFEAEYLVRLCKYFLLQGYHPSQIAVLATYGGQVLILKKEMKNLNIPEDVRVTTVDNFQGEESVIILLSLVRSNKQDNVGFLKVDNRVCVALSRAKKGMFVIGNLALLASQSKLWQKIKTTAELEGITGDGLPISCPNHPDEKNVIRVPSDFDRSPEGGCLKKCNVRLGCGHMCRLTCHGYDSEHKEIRCHSPCTKSCPEGHPCLKRCWKECGPCLVQVQKQITACGHTNTFSCSKNSEETDCYSQCGTVLPCGHHCTGKCGKCKQDAIHKQCIAQVQKQISSCGHTNTFCCSKNPEETDCYSQCGTVLPCGHHCTEKCGKCKQDAIHKQCRVPVTYTWPCDHSVEVPCHFKPTENPCPKPCGEILLCGHKCPGKCSDCLRGAVHVACREKCKKTLFCGHICQSVCSIPCSPCSLPCPVACRHGPCGHKNEKHTCGESCTPCEKPCLNKCRHRKCTRKCHEKCDITPCKERCLKRLDCGHDCSGLCGEMCVCSTCHRVSRIREFKNEETSSSHVQHHKSKLLLRLPSCQHVFFLDEIDKYIALMGNKTSGDFICCPECSNLIVKCHRYDHILKDQHLTRVVKKKEIVKQNKVVATKSMIKDSVQLVEETDASGLWVDLYHTDVDVVSAKHFPTLSLKLKFAYVINAIISLQRKYPDFSQGEETQERVLSLLKVGKHMSLQQIEEYKLDLKRLLLCQYSGILKSLADCHKVVLSRATTRTYRDSREELKTARPAKTVLAKTIAVTNIMETTIKNNCSDPVVKDTLLFTKSKAARALDVLSADSEEVLKDIIRRRQSRARPQQASRPFRRIPKPVIKGFTLKKTT